MLDQRTDALISSYMRWTNKKVLSPEEYLMFRRQAIEEEFAGVPEPVTAAQTPKSTTGVVHGEGAEVAPQANAESQNGSTQRKTDVNVPYDNKGAPTSEFASAQQNQEKKKDKKGFGMSNADFLAFMQSVPD